MRIFTDGQVQLICAAGTKECIVVPRFSSTVRMMWLNIYEFFILFFSSVFTNICSCSRALRERRPPLNSVWDRGTQRGALTVCLWGDPRYQSAVDHWINQYAWTCMWNNLPGKVTFVIKDRAIVMNNAWFHKWMISVLSQKGPSSVEDGRDLTSSSISLRGENIRGMAVWKHMRCTTTSYNSLRIKQRAHYVA